MATFLNTHLPTTIPIVCLPDSIFVISFVQSKQAVGRDDEIKCLLEL